jgi:hypothetical protein
MKAPDFEPKRLKKEKKMSQETTHAGMQGDWKRLMTAIEANIAELGHLEVSRVKLGGLLAQAEEINKQQKALTASKQEASRQLKLLMTEGQRLSNALRTMVKEHYGIRAEKLAEFGLQPFRGRTRKAKTAPTEPTPPTPTPTDPTNPVR